MEQWNVHLEPMIQGVRVFAKEKGYGDEYICCGTARYRSPTDVELTLITKSPTTDQWKAVLRKFADTGVKTVRFKRIRHGVEREHVFDLT